MSNLVLLYHVFFNSKYNQLKTLQRTTAEYISKLIA